MDALKTTRSQEESEELEKLKKETGEGGSLWNMLTSEGKAAKEKFEALPEEERNAKLDRLRELQGEPVKESLWSQIKMK